MLQGYARVSTADQNPDAQRDALIRAGVRPEHLYVDHTSGAKSSRPHWDALYKALRPGDVLVATRLDRVGRSTSHLVGERGKPWEVALSCGAVPAREVQGGDADLRTSAALDPACQHRPPGQPCS